MLILYGEDGCALRIPVGIKQEKTPHYSWYGSPYRRKFRGPCHCWGKPEARELYNNYIHNTE